ncbi:recombinase RecT [Desemzia sp. C1]|uniref:recombinase RecT n=1 Tax=Desemzia sp. C1 TaxID=2892016 RepID=UPI001E5A35E7|nr:recombinase RecT [Desemzia sp. C1]MCI3027722.1 recombinase RecT [Desemzia sp. C1]
MSNEMALLQKDITDHVSGKLSELESTGLNFPPNYNPQNALKSAFFKLQETKDRKDNPALSVCTTDSIANALLDMVVQGLSPAKTQCYFIVYGNTLKLNRSYFGTQAVLKRLKGVKDIWANVIYDADEFVMAIEKGKEVLIKHETKFENRDGGIKGVYCIIEKEDGAQELTVMTKKEVEAAWSQSKTGQSVHKKFPQEMAKRTVINRAAKNIINTSDDSDLLIEAINNTTDSEFEPSERKHVDEAEIVQDEVDQNANQKVLDFDTIPAERTVPVEVRNAEPVYEEVAKDPDEEQGRLFDNLAEMEPKF